MTSTTGWVVAFLCVVLLCASCQKNCYLLEPTISYCPPKHLVERLPSAFPTLSNNELNTEWGKELRIANLFAKELDLYRAITSYKRARFLLPRDQGDRRLQIDYCIILCYYLGGKYQECVETFETSDLLSVGPTFPALGELLIILYDAYERDCRLDRAEALLQLIEKHSCETARDLSLQQAVVDGDLCAAYYWAEQHPEADNITPYLDDYCCCAKSPRQAQALNAILPGAGYYYVEQKQTAVTSFLLNALFTWAAVYFFDHGNIPMGIILSSLEAGWYFGGINGAGLAAKEYNERLFECKGRDLLAEHRLFPFLMFETAF